MFQCGGRWWHVGQQVYIGPYGNDGDFICRIIGLDNEYQHSNLVVRSGYLQRSVHHSIVFPAQ